MRVRAGRGARLAPPREANPWLPVVTLATEHGRADVLRWLYTDHTTLSYLFCFDKAIDGRYGAASSARERPETYEIFGRRLACGQDTLTLLYDDLRAAHDATHAHHDAVKALKALFGLEYILEDSSKSAPVAPSVAEIVDAVGRIDEVCRRFPSHLLHLATPLPHMAAYLPHMATSRGH